MALSAARDLPPCFGPCFIQHSNKNENHPFLRKLQDYSESPSDLLNSVLPAVFISEVRFCSQELCLSLVLYLNP